MRVNRIGNKIKEDLENSPFGLMPILGAASLVAMTKEAEVWTSMANLDRASSRLSTASLRLSHLDKSLED